MLEVTHTLGKWFVLHAIHHSCDFEGTKRPLIWLLLLFNKQRMNHLQIHTHSEMHEVSDISRFTICSETCPTRSKVAYFMWQKIKIVLLFSVIILACVVYSIAYVSYNFAKFMSCLSCVYLNTCMYYIPLRTCHNSGVYSVVPSHSWDFASDYYWFIWPLQINICHIPSDGRSQVRRWWPSGWFLREIGSGSCWTLKNW